MVIPTLKKKTKHFETLYEWLFNKPPLSAPLRNPTADQARRGHLAGSGNHLAALPARDPRVQHPQLGLQGLPDLLLLDLVGARGRGLLPGPRAVELEPDPVSRRGARGGVEGLDVLVGRVGCAEQHAVRLHAPHVPRLEVAERDDEPVAHLVDRDELDEAGDDGAGLRVAEVHGLDVEPVGCLRTVGSFWERDKVC
jgi:hypothetical protein